MIRQAVNIAKSAPKIVQHYNNTMISIEGFSVAGGGGGWLYVVYRVLGGWDNDSV